MAQDKIRPLRIDDIANIAGVSIATVSRVLNGSDKVSKKTRRKVLQVIESVDYTPNEMARGLVMKKNKVIGILMSDILNGYYAEITNYIEPILKEKGYALQLCITSTEEDRIRDNIDNLLRRRVAGIIILSLKIDSQDIVRKMLNNTAVVSIEGDVDGIDLVGVENEEGIYAAVNNLIENGHRRIAFVGYQFDHVSLARRVDGYKRALRDHGIDIRDAYIIDEGKNTTPGYSAVMQLFALKEPPTAIQCMNEYCAQGVYRALMENGRRIPEDVSVSAFDGQKNMELLFPRLTTAAIPMKDMAKAAVDLILQNIDEGNSEVVRSIKFPPILKMGNSVKCIADIGSRPET